MLKTLGRTALEIARSIDTGHAIWHGAPTPSERASRDASAATREAAETPAEESEELLQTAS